MSVEDATGAQKKTWHPVVRFASVEPGTTPKIGLIQEDIPYEPWMSVIRLFVHGKEVAKYEAGPPAPGAGGGVVAAGAVPGGASLALEAAGPDRPNRRNLRLARGMQVREGVTYTVQVRPEGSEAWRTITVGRDTPETEIDRNQFPGSRHVDVRVLRTTGFDENVVAEQKFDLGN
jgi:hypothetical protein